MYWFFLLLTRSHFGDIILSPTSGPQFSLYPFQDTCTSPLSVIESNYRPPIGKIRCGQLYSTPIISLLFFCFVSVSSFHIVTPEMGFPNFAELPAGLIDDGERPEAAAIRELRKKPDMRPKAPSIPARF